jgi:3-dehydroquinate synthase
MKRVPVKTPTNTYPILIGNGLIGKLGTLLGEELNQSGTVVVVTNPTIGRIYADSVIKDLNDAGFESGLAEVPDGEKYKTLHTIEKLYDRFLDLGLDRSGVVVALGGGVVGDMAGFASATFMRGTRFVQVPTSLLAMVDASIGGKTGVDLKRGKNLVGVFKQPEMVVVSPDVLATLPKEEFAAGMAEVIKHGIIDHVELFERLEKGDVGDKAKLVEEAIQVKISLVQRDPFEHGPRALLNLGHTFGHAFELLSNFELRHGEAVASGLVAATELSAKLRECDPALTGRVELTVNSYNLLSRLAGFGVDQVINAMQHDKKSNQGRLRFVIPKELGHCKVVEEVPREALRSAISRVLK